MPEPWQLRHCGCEQSTLRRPTNEQPRSVSSTHQWHQPNDWEVLLMLARPHPCLGWLHISPNETRKVMDRLLRDRDAALDANSTFSGMPRSFIDWTWHTWLTANMHRYEKQRHE